MSSKLESTICDSGQWIPCFANSKKLRLTKLRLAFYPDAFPDFGFASTYLQTNRDKFDCSILCSACGTAVPFLSGNIHCTCVHCVG